jgi:hypothetical protein
MVRLLSSEPHMYKRAISPGLSSRLTLLSWQDIFVARSANGEILRSRISQEASESGIEEWIGCTILEP